MTQDRDERVLPSLPKRVITELSREDGLHVLRSALDLACCCTGGRDI